MSALAGGTALWGGLALVAVAVGLLVFGVASIFFKEESVLAQVLRPYDEVARAAAAADAQQEDEVLGPPSFAQTRLVQRAVAVIESLTSRRGLLPRVAVALERADLPVRAAEALFIFAAAVVFMGVLALALTPTPLVGLVLTAGFALGAPTVVSVLAGRRRRAFLAQLPDALQLLSSSLQAGYSLLQGIEAVSSEVAEPMGRELRRVVVEARLGRPVEDSLGEVAERMDSPDFAWAVLAIGIQREVGGNLAELLMTVATTIIERDRLRRDVSSLTAEGRMSAIVLGLLPVVLGGAMWVMNRDYIALLFTERVGNVALGGAVVLAVVGFYWMKKTVEIEV